jgi:hypothetical protein
VPRPVLRCDVKSGQRMRIRTYKTGFLENRIRWCIQNFVEAGDALPSRMKGYCCQSLYEGYGTTRAEGVQKTAFVQSAGKVGASKTLTLQMLGLSESFLRLLCHTSKTDPCDWERTSVRPVAEFFEIVCQRPNSCRVIIVGEKSNLERIRGHRL